MSLPKRIQARKERDQDFEREYNIRKNDPVTEQYDGRTYTPADIDAIEREKLGAAWRWMKRKSGIQS